MITALTEFPRVRPGLRGWILITAGLLLGLLASCRWGDLDCNFDDPTVLYTCTCGGVPVCGAAVSTASGDVVPWGQCTCGGGS